MYFPELNKKSISRAARNRPCGYLPR